MTFFAKALDMRLPRGSDLIAPPKAKKAPLTFTRKFFDEDVVSDQCCKDRQVIPEFSKHTKNSGTSSLNVKFIDNTAAAETLELITSKMDCV